MSPRVQFESREVGSVVELTVRGVADIAAAALIKEGLIAALAADRDVQVHLDDLERLDGAGVQLLLAARARAESLGRAFVVHSSTGPAHRALALAGASTLLLPLRPSEP